MARLRARLSLSRRRASAIIQRTLHLQPLFEQAVAGVIVAHAIRDHAKERAGVRERRPLGRAAGQRLQQRATTLEQVAPARVLALTVAEEALVAQRSPSICRLCTACPKSGTPSRQLLCDSYSQKSVSTAWLSSLTGRCVAAHSTATLGRI